MSFAGNWKLIDGENFREFFTELKVPPVIQQSLVKTKLTARVKITSSGSHFKVRHEEYKPQEYTFGSATEHTYSVFDKSILFLTSKHHDKKYVHVGFSEYGEIWITRELIDPLMVVTIKVSNVQTNLILKYQNQNHRQS